jgi:hypothetical protein
MMRSLYLAAACAASVFALTAEAAPAFSAPEIKVGRNLQAIASVILPQPAPAEGLPLTITSDDPARVLFSAAPDKAGSASITVTVRPKSPISPEFWAHGLGDSGAVPYTISAPGLDSAKGSVNLGPSGIAIVGPFRLPSFQTTPRGVPSKLTLVAALLDASGKGVEEQQVAGGRPVEVTIASSSPEAGAPADQKVTIPSGASVAVTYFKPAAEGSTTLTPRQPAGFKVPNQFASVIAMIERPSIAITDELSVGHNLQMLGVLCLGEAPPEGGTKVTLTSSDPSKLVLSAHEDELGSGTLTITVPVGEMTAKYYIQALGDSGAVTYKATAEGFRHRIAKIGLAKSGFMVAYERYGPPDEAHVLRKGGAEDERRFYPSLAQAKDTPVNLVVYSAYIDPASGMSADITVQPLRAGVSAVVKLKSSNPAVGQVESPLTIASGNNRVLSRFTPLSLGETVVSLEIPDGFSAPKNATSAPATVNP